MISDTLLLLFMAALTAAQSSAVSLFLPFADQQSLVASIAASDSTATTYVVACAKSAAAASPTAYLSDVAAATTQSAYTCGFSSAFTVTEGPSTVHYSINLLGDSASVDCVLSGSTYALCTASASVATDQAATGISGGMTTTSITGNDVQSLYMPVVITAGSATAKAVSATTTTGTASKGGSTMSTGSAMSGASTGSSTGTSTGPSSTAATKSTNGAMAAAPILGAGILGALGVAVAGAML